MKKRFLIGGIAAAAVFATVLGVAASLNVTSEGLGAGSASVQSCDTDGVTTSYTVAWDNTDNRFEVTGVTVSGIHTNNCNGYNVQIALLGTSNTVLATAGPQTVSGASVNFNSLSNPPAASDVDKVQVTIYK
ncbi:hypothetical protein HRbin24_01986 [bacterium HR24]|nr:hypothetical protein HRbin24_01986 [bacterium HR24]